ncbi:MAG: hypothetical protein JNK45_02550 [Myxococcales bacterium]|nr:hypothetical protein [Myxococcales bacterium]
MATPTSIDRAPGWCAALLLLVACGGGSSDDGGSSASTDPASSGTANSETADSGSSTADGGTTGAPPIDLGCLDPQPLLQVDGVTPSGFVVCSDGFVHRAEAVSCVVPDAGDCDDCASDCSDGPLGRCMSDPGFGTCSCVYGCETDADCGEGSACACAGPSGGVPRCVPATCTTSADCGDGLCGRSGSNQCGFDDTLACLGATSECRSTTCEDGLEECVCYADSGEFRCHAECFTGCG